MPSLTIEMSSDEAKLWRGLARLEAKNKDLESSLGKVGRTGRASGKALEDSFGGKALSSARSLATQYVGLSAAVSAIGSEFNYMKQESDAAIESMRQVADPNRSLAQVAMSAEDLRAMISQADAMAIAAGMDRNAARRVRFSARSEGFESALGDITKNAIVIDPEAQATIAGQIPSMFKGTSPSAAIDLTLLNAEKSRLRFEDLARAMPMASQGAAQAGSSLAETEALLSVLASRFKSGDEAATAIKSFGSKVALDPSMKGKGIVSAFDELRKMQDDQRSEFLGENEQLNAMYTMLIEDIETVRQRTREGEAELKLAGTSRSLIARKRMAAQQVLGPTQRIEGSENAVKIARETSNQNEADTVAAINNAIADLKASKVSPIRKFVTETGIWAERYLGITSGRSEESIRKHVAGGGYFPGLTASPGDVQAQMDRARDAREREAAKLTLDAAKDIRSAAAELKKAARSEPPPRPRSLAPSAQAEANHRAE